MAKFLCMEIGNSSVRLAEVNKKATKNGTVATITKTYDFDTPDDATKDGKVRVADNIVAAIKNGLVDSGILTNDVYFAIESTKILFKQVELPLVQKRLIEGMLQNSFSDIFPVDELLYHVSYVYKKAFDKNGKKMMLLDVFAIPNDISESYYNLAVALNLNVKGLAPAGYSMTYVAPEIFEGRNIAMVNIGENISTLTVTVDGNTVFNKTINAGVRGLIQQLINSPLTMDDLTVTGAAELLYSQNILLQKTPTAQSNAASEQDKLRNLATMSVVQFAQAIESTFAAFLSKESVHIQEFILCGLGAGFANISQLLTYLFGITVTVVQQYSKLQISPVAAEDTLLISCYPCVAACLSDVNLFTSEERAGGDIAKKKKIDKICSILAIVAVCGVMGYSAYSLLQTGIEKQDALDENKRLTNKIQELRDLGVEKAYNDYSAAESKNKTLEEIYALTSNGNENMTVFLDELSRVLYGNCHVTAVTLSAESATVSISGSSSNAALTLSRLRHLTTASDMECSGFSEDDNSNSGNPQSSFTCTFKLLPTPPREYTYGVKNDTSNNQNNTNNNEDFNIPTVPEVDNSEENTSSNNSWENPDENTEQNSSDNGSDNSNTNNGTNENTNQNEGWVNNIPTTPDGN